MSYSTKVREFLEVPMQCKVGDPSQGKIEHRPKTRLFSTDSSSQFSVDVDIVEVETISRIPVDAENGAETETGLGIEILEAREIVLNASRLKVESETG